MVKIHIIAGTTRPNRVGISVAEWVYEQAQQRTDMEVELVDIAEFKLPLFDEPTPPSIREEHTNPHSQKWATKIGEADGYVFVTGEYNHSVPGALKNAIDYLFNEWNDKAAGFVSYGSASGVRAVEHLRGIMGEIRIADVREQVMLNLATDFKNYSEFTPGERQAAALRAMLDRLVAWTEAMKTLR